MLYIYTGLIFLYIFIFKIFSNFNTRILEWFFIIFLLIIASIRSDVVGADTYNYVVFFEKSPTITNFDINYRPELEYGFKIYLSVLRTVTESKELFLLISTAICIIPLYAGLKKIAPKYAFAGLLLYFFVFYLNYPINVLRQGMVMSIFVYALPSILDKKHSNVLFLSILAGSLHNTGYLIFIAYMYSLFENKKLIYIGIFLILFSLILYKYSFLQSILFTYIAEDKEVTFTEKFSSSTSASQYLYRISLLIFFSICAWLIKNKDLTKIFAIYILGFFVYIALSDNNLIAARFNMVFRILEVVMISLIFYFCKNIKYKMILFILFILLFLPFFFVTALQPVNEYRVSDFL